jgi:hypothetical protein
MQPAYASILARSVGLEPVATPVPDADLPVDDPPDPAAAATVVLVPVVASLATPGDELLEHAARPATATADAMINPCTARMSSPWPNRRAKGYAEAGYTAGTTPVTSL